MKTPEQVIQQMEEEEDAIDGGSRVWFNDNAVVIVAQAMQQAREQALIEAEMLVKRLCQVMWHPDDANELCAEINKLNKDLLMPDLIHNWKDRVRDKALEEAANHIEPPFGDGEIIDALTDAAQQIRALKNKKA